MSARPPITLQEVRSLLENVRGRGNQLSARCPAHNDKENSFSITESKKGRILFHCHAGCSYESILAALGLGINEMLPPRKKIVAQYPYCDEHGNTLYEVVRYEPKGFKQRRSNKQGKAVWNLDGVPRVLYHLPELLIADKQEIVFIVEGEKDVDRLHSLGLIATTNSGGAEKWRDEYNQYLSNRNVIIIPDNDAAGRRHAEHIAQSIHGVAASVKVLGLQGLPYKGDVSDWLNAGGTVERLHALVQQTLFWNLSNTVTENTTDNVDKSGRPPSQATRLVELAAEAELFHTPDRDAYATVTVNEHRETWPLRSKSFRLWLARLYYEAYKQAASSQAMNDALAALEGKALFEGLECAIYRRLAEHDGVFYLDLCDSQWRVVMTTREGWRIINAHECPVRFRRAKGMLPLPEPEHGGSVGLLRQFINIANDNDWALLLAWIVAALRPFGPYPILILHGEQGSAKTTLARILRLLIDPNTADLRSDPRNEHDLVIAANNGWVIMLDNLSHLPNWLSDAICRLSTGGGFGTRTLYENDEETLFNSMRPVLLNGIEELATRGDLLDRAMILYLPSISKKKRRLEATLWSDVKQVIPNILGTLCDAVSAALLNVDAVKVSERPRMADFAVWATAAEGALGLKPNQFIDAYSNNRESANTLALESSPVAATTLVFMAGRDEWLGTATELLRELNQFTGESIQKQHIWPKTGKALSNTLRRLAPNLRAAGIALTFDQREAGTGRRLISLEKTSNTPSQPSQ
jgi:hypothetical protein